MAFLRASTGIDAETEVRGTDVYLRHPTMTDYAAWAQLRALSREHLVGWEPQWARDELARSAFRRRLRQHQANCARIRVTPSSFSAPTTPCLAV
jgi:ribosomal-protein-alanine N-acetyltransferase